MMTLLHYKLLHFISDKKLLKQLTIIKVYLKSSIFPILPPINYIAEYPTSDLLRYIRYIYAELNLRHLELNLRHLEINKDDVYIFYLNHQNELADALNDNEKVFKNHHTLRYMIECYFLLEMEYNLKIDTDYDFDEMKQFVRKRLENELF